MSVRVVESAVVSAAEALGIELRPQMAERIASGAQSAVAAVAQASQQWGARATGEPGEYLALLESLAPETPKVPQDSQARETSGVTRSGAMSPAGDSIQRIAEVLDLSLCEAHRALAHLDAGIDRLTEVALERAQAMQAQTHAWLSIEPDAARARTTWLQTLAKESPDVARRMPLFAIPLAHKDMFNLPVETGYRSPSCGSHVPSRLQSSGVATVIQRLELAGAVTLGTLNMAEFALGATGHNGARGDCANAWHPDYISGGSSSGSAVAVARGAVFASLGSDTGGSVRIPASVNGVLGLKPTYGLIPRTGSMRLSPSIDVIGPMARSARDLARLLSIVAGADGVDPHCSARSVPDFEQALQQPIEGLRIGLPDRYFFEDVDLPVRKALDQVRARLETAGAEFVPVEMPDISSLAELSRAVVYAEATGLHAAMLRESAGAYSPQVRLRASTGLGIPAPVYGVALGLRLTILQEFVGRVFAHCDALFTPTIPLLVPRRDATDVGAGESLWPILARLVRCTAPINFLGLPAISIPAGRDPHGLPIGAQFIGRPFDESLLLRLAAALPTDVPIARPLA